MLLTIELPTGKFIKINVEETTTLKEISVLVQLKNPVFFCDRWNGELGTLISMEQNDDPIQKFNTNSITLIDRDHIQEKDVPRYYTAMTKGY